MNFLFCFRCRKMTRESRRHGKVAFNDYWLSDEKFKLWLKKGQDRNKAVCSLCSNSVAVSHAEIHWVMKVVTFHFSYRSCINLNSLLASVFSR